MAGKEALQPGHCSVRRALPLRCCRLERRNAHAGQRCSVAHRKGWPAWLFPAPTFKPLVGRQFLAPPRGQKECKAQCYYPHSFVGQGGAIPPGEFLFRGLSKQSKRPGRAPARISAGQPNMPSRKLHAEQPGCDHDGGTTLTRARLACSWPRVSNFSVSSLHSLRLPRWPPSVTQSPRKARPAKERRMAASLHANETPLLTSTLLSAAAGRPRLRDGQLCMHSMQSRPRRALNTSPRADTPCLCKP